MTLNACLSCWDIRRKEETYLSGRDGETAFLPDFSDPVLRRFLMVALYRISYREGGIRCREPFHEIRNTRCAKDPQSLIEKGKGYGVYHVNFDSKAVQQLMLNPPAIMMDRTMDAPPIRAFLNLELLN